MSSLIPEKQIRVNCTPEDYYVYSEINERRLYLYGEILPTDEDEYAYNGGKISAIINQILDYNREDMEITPSKRKPIYLYINSPGGDIVEGFALISVIEASKTPVYTINVGQWSSMSFLIGIAGAKRLSLPYMAFLMHDGASIAIGSTNKVQDRLDFEKRFEQKVVKTHILKHSNLKPIDYDALARIELYMLPEDALERGFIDEIITDIDAIL